MSEETPKNLEIPLNKSFAKAKIHKVCGLILAGRKPDDEIKFAMVAANKFNIEEFFIDELISLLPFLGRDQNRWLSKTIIAIYCLFRASRQQIDHQKPCSNPPKNL